MKHWTNFLPEAGRQAQSLGRQQEFKALQINEAIEHLQQLNLEYNDEEKNIVEIIGRDWSETEIEVAKKEADLANLKS